MSKIVDINSKSNKSSNQSIVDRIYSCEAKGGNCSCMYCEYTKNTADMILDIIEKDMFGFSQRTNAEFCTVDMKRILFQAIKDLKQYEADELNRMLDK